MYVRDTVRTSFTWDATNVSPQRGDQLTAALPAHFASLGSPRASSLILGGQAVGECELGERTITCALNDAIRGKTNVHGAGYALLKAVQTTAATASDTVVNDVVLKVAELLSGDGAGRLPAGTEYAVNATWTLPDGKTTADCPSCVASPSPLPVTVRAGQVTQPEATFPVGAVIIFAQDLGAVQHRPEPPGAHPSCPPGRSR